MKYGPAGFKGKHAGQNRARGPDDGYNGVRSVHAHSSADNQVSWTMLISWATARHEHEGVIFFDMTDKDPATKLPSRVYSVLSSQLCTMVAPHSLYPSRVTKSFDRTQPPIHAA